MRRILSVVAAGAALGLISASAAAAEPVLFQTVTVSPSVVVAISDRGSNIGCVALDDGLVFIDASLSTRVAADFRQAMEKRFERPATTLFVTHAHLDHVLGMGAFADLDIVAAASGRGRWERLLQLPGNEQAMASWAAVFPSLPEDIVDARMSLPTSWFEGEVTIGSGATKLAVVRTGGHTVDSSSALVTGEGVVFAGDLVQARRRPYFGEPDTDLDAWIRTLAGWEATAPRAVVGGHGPAIDGVGLKAIRVWFESTVAAVADLKAAGVPVEDVVSHADLPAGYWPADEPVKPWWGYCFARLYQGL